MTATKINEDQKLIDNIDALLLELSTTDSASPHHDALIEKLKKLNDLRTSTPEKRKLVDPNQLIAAGASIGGILIIIGYEHGHVIASKALNFVFKK